MRLPLIVHASPSVRKTPVVLLRKGEWKVESDVKDTEFKIFLNEAVVDYTDRIVVKDRDYAQLVIIKAGTEKSISIDLVRVGD